MVKRRLDGSGSHAVTGIRRDPVARLYAFRVEEERPELAGFGSTAWERVNCAGILRALHVGILNVKWS